jgi:hypothetical protein
MTQQPPPLTDQRTITVLDPDHIPKALEVAKRIAEQTGQTIIVRDADGLRIGTVYPTRHQNCVAKSKPGAAPHMTSSGGS